jgi:hypothetical protein
MTRRRRQAHEALCRDFLAQTGDRLEQLRSAAERSTANRLELERALDHARGLGNRVLARVEAARQASDDAWPFARAQADQAIADMAQAIAELEQALSKAAA